MHLADEASRQHLQLIVYQGQAMISSFMNVKEKL